MRNKALLLFSAWQVAFVIIVGAMLNRHIDRIESIDNRVGHIEEILDIVQSDPN